MKSKRILFETILVTAVTLLGMWFVPTAKTLFALIPVAYLLIERRLRKRTWGDLGFNFRTFWADLRANWVLFVLLGFVIQPVSVLVGQSLLPRIPGTRPGAAAFRERDRLGRVAAPAGSVPAR